jgi:hypothetical protein
MARRIASQKPPEPAPPAEPTPGNKRGSGFRYTELGALVQQKPAEAAVLLRALIAANGGNVSAVARDRGVAYKTLTRWISSLAAMGHDPRPAPAAVAP